MGFVCGAIVLYRTRPSSRKSTIGHTSRFLLGPIGVGITFFLKPDAEGGEEVLSTADSGFDKLSDAEQHTKISEALNNKKAKSSDELKKDLERMKANVSKL